MSRLTAMPARQTTALIVATLFLFAGISLFFLPKKLPAPPAPTSQTAPTTYPGLDLEDPEASYQTLRYVTETGGDNITRSQALIWLDQQARSQQPLMPSQETYILHTLTNGGHPTWDIEYKLWLFNSSFNVLHYSENPLPLTQILHHLAASHPHRTMRLYALQHIGIQRESGRLTGALADEIYHFLKQQITHPESETAGTAIQLLLTWNRDQTSTDSDLIARALELATDTTRSTDIRITALQAAQSHALSPARTLAADPAQPVLLRKAAIAIIGQHGSENDLPSLLTLSSENFRLAQAADPAQAAIQQRQKNPNIPDPIPF